MVSHNLHAALARLDVMDEALAALRMLLADDDERIDGGRFLVKTIGVALADAAHDIAALMNARQQDVSHG